MSSTVQPVEEVKDPVENKSNDLNPRQTKLIVGGLIVGTILLIFLLFTQTLMQPTLLIIGLLLGYTFFGSEVSGFVSPVGVSLLVGAFIFGIGMQLGGGCASGTLYAVGSGRSVMFITLLFFIIGTTIGAYHLPFWTEDLPAFEPIS